MPAEIVKVALSVVEFTSVTPLTVIPVPDTFIVFPPGNVKLVPVSVTATLVELPVECVADVGEIAVSVGAVTATILNAFDNVTLPPGVVTVTLLAPSAAPVAIVKFAVIVVEFTTVTPLTLTLVPDMVTEVPLVVKLVPVRVTATLVPCAPDVGAMELSVGAGGLTIVNVTALLVPPGVVTVTFLVPGIIEAVAEISKVAATCVELNTVTPVMVTPAIGLIVALIRFVPSRVTCTLLPR